MDDSDRTTWLQPPEYTPTVPNMLADCIRRYGDNPLILDNKGQFTYSDVIARSERLAKFLLSMGVGKGTRVAMLLPNSLEWLVSYFAATRIGAVAVPIHTIYRERELHYILRHSDAHTLITRCRYLSHDYIDRLEKIAPSLRTQQAPTPIFEPELPYLRQVLVWGDDCPRWARSVEQGLAALTSVDGLLQAVEAEVTPSDLAFMMYTSGSTSNPKGVIHTQAAIITRSHMTRGSYAFGEQDRILITGPFCWAARFMSLMLALHAGASVICPDNTKADTLLDTMIREGPTLVAAPPAMLKDLQVNPRVLSGEVDARTAAALHRKDASGAIVPDEWITNGLGMTETVCPHSLEVRGLIPRSKPGIFGRGVPDIERRIRDPETGAWLQVGETGELWLRGPNLMAGYYKKTRAEVFDEDGYFNTNDLCMIDEDGFLHYFGRNNDMIKAGGANVAPREIEILLESYPEVQEAGVFGMPAGGFNEIVTAVIVAAPGVHPDVDALKARMRSDISAFKVPKALHVAAYDALPRTGSGKLDKRTIRARLLETGSPV